MDQQLYRYVVAGVPLRWSYKPAGLSLSNDIEFEMNRPFKNIWQW